MFQRQLVFQPDTSRPDLVATDFPGLLAITIPAADGMPRVRAPVLILQGARDMVVTPAMGRAMFAAAPEPKQLWTAPDAGHNDLLAAGLAPVILGFLAHHLSEPAHLP